MPDSYVDISSLVSTLISLKAADPTKKVAFVFSGGGARGAWFGGVIEAVEGEVRRQQPSVAPERRFAPDLLVGTSAGGIAALGYLADLLVSDDYIPYANRQSWLWRALSEGNEAAFKLLDNAGILELLSGSRRDNGDGAVPSDLFSSIGITTPSLSPSYSFATLLDAVVRIKGDLQSLETQWSDFCATLDQIQVDLKGKINALGDPHLVQNLLDPLTIEIRRVTDGLSRIRTRIDNVDSVARQIKSDLNSARFKKALEKIDNLVKAGGNVVGGLFQEAVTIHQVATKLPMLPIQNSISEMEPLVLGSVQLLETFAQMNATVGRGTLNFLRATIEFGAAIDDAIKLLVNTVTITRKSASLMDVPGLKNSLNEVLRLASPVPVDSSATSGVLDAAVLAHWRSRRTQKASDPFVRAPELLLTAANITAKRLALLALCEGQTMLNLGRTHSWVIALDEATTAFMRTSERSSVPSPADPRRWVFGATGYEGATVVAGQPKVADRMGKTRAAVAIGSPATASRRPGGGPGSSGPTGPMTPHGSTPFEWPPGVSHIQGTSVLAGAALTTAAIPIGFPPRRWRFQNPIAGPALEHWFADGGMCDNRPVQQAIEAGADYIVSFELVPLRLAVQDIPTDGGKIKLKDVIGTVSSLPLTSSFNRFLETYVADNATSTKRIWRIAPGATADGDETVDTYDFNGVWEDGQVQMGLYDWFMRGYFDAFGALAASVAANLNDPVVRSYGEMLNSGQLRDAAFRPGSPGFFEVDFANNHPHPGYP